MGGANFESRGGKKYFCKNLVILRMTITVQLVVT